MHAKSGENTYAIIKTGGKQYRVKEGDIISVELLKADVGSEVQFDQVLFVGSGQEFQVGSPAVANYFVKAEILGEVSGPKVTSIKYKPSHNQVRKFGHRQHYSRVKIVGIGKQ